MEHNDYPSYNASVEMAEGKQVWKKNGLKGQSGRRSGLPVTLKRPRISSPRQRLPRQTHWSGRQRKG